MAPKESSVSSHVFTLPQFAAALKSLKFTFLCLVIAVQIYYPFEDAIYTEILSHHFELHFVEVSPAQCALHTLNKLSVLLLVIFLFNSPS